MHSIRTRLTLMTICAVIVAVVITAVIGAISIGNLGNSDAEQMLQMQCETGEKNLDSYFNRGW